MKIISRSLTEVPIPADNCCFPISLIHYPCSSISLQQNLFRGASNSLLSMHFRRLLLKIGKDHFDQVVPCIQYILGFILVLKYYILTTHFINQIISYLFIFNWRMIVLKYFVGFHYTSTWISIGIPVVPPSLTFLLPPTASHPSRLLQSSDLSYLSHPENSYWLSVLHMIVYLFPCYSFHSSHPVVPLPTCVSISLFSMSVSPLLFCI